MEMEEVQVTWKHAIKIWWSWLWRAMLWTLPTALAFGFIVGLVMAMSGIPIEPYQLYLQAAGGFIGIFFGIYTLKIILTKKSFNGFRIVLVKTSEVEGVNIDA
jgi:hypothetical protein